MLFALRFFAMEMKKLLSLPAYRYSLLLIGVLIVLFHTVSVAGRESAGTSWANTFSNTLSLISYVGTLTMIVVTAQFLASEYSNRTIQRAVSHGISRWTFMLSKVLTLLFGSYLLVLTTTILSFATAVLLSSALGRFHPTDINMVAVLYTLLLLPLKFFPIIMVAFSLTVLLRSAIFPIAGLFFYMLLGELILSEIFNRVGWKTAVDYLPGSIATPIDTITLHAVSLVQNDAVLDRLSRALDQQTMTFSSSYIGIAIYLFIGTLFSFVIVRRQDLSR